MAFWGLQESFSCKIGYIRKSCAEVQNNYIMKKESDAYFRDIKNIF